MYMRNKQNINPRAEATKVAALGVAWGVVAGIAYLGLLKRMIDVIKSATGWAGPGGGFDGGLIAIDPARAGQPHTSLYIIAISALPIAILAVIGLGIAAGIRPKTFVLSGLLIAAALLGLLGVVLLFLDVVATVANGSAFLLALATIVIVSILLRLQRSVRHFYRRNPALVSLIIGVVVIAYIFITNGATSISGIILSDIDIWLALIAFAIALYSGIALARLGRWIR